ncbi:MAG: hypothetical protein ACP5IL_07535 [Syntrophobacteraceae bacterium]
MIRTPSLAQYFDAPEDYMGYFGWICGYSADTTFLNDAAERFTGQTMAQRAYGGNIYLAAMLDDGNPYISSVDAPGVAHLPIKSLERKPFVLLHAKVALLGFRHRNDISRWKLRIIVSTGNWTQQTLESTLDLAWWIDLSSEQLSGVVNNDVRQCCADIKAVQNLFLWMGELFDQSLLGASRENDTARKKVNEWIEQCFTKADKTRPRFFDNRKKALLAQLPKIIQEQTSKVSRNYLAMGSGFYESASDQNRVPAVIESIVSSLRNAFLLTNSAEMDIFVNPGACQAVALSVKALNSGGFKVRPAAPPPLVFGENSGRTLHAKFLFSANKRNNSNNCSAPWVYLGSGNLTGPGFANQMSADRGNLEAGVVFAPQNLFWEISRGIDPGSVVTNLLPIQWDSDIRPDDPTIEAGGDMPTRDEQFVAAPVAWLKWSDQGDGNSGILQRPPDSPAELDVLSQDGETCTRNKQGFFWPGPRPRQVIILYETNDGRQQKCIVPVVDEFGRIAATTLPKLDLDAAWWQLADFPMPPEDEYLDREDAPVEDVYTQSGKASRVSASITYPVRQMMELIENIAAKQTEVREADWQVWCNRLKQTLNQMKGDPVIEYFRSDLKLNPLSPLDSAPFRPFFAETAQNEHGKRYQEVLQTAMKAWGVNDLAAIGETQ